MAEEETGQGVKDDPIEWLVSEFGATDLTFGELGAIELEIGPLTIRHQPEDLPFWSINGCKCHPLTRADVARLCELFGVEVKR